MENKLAIILTSESSIEEVLTAAPDVLLESQAKVEKAVTTCINLLSRIEKEGMSDELDALCNQAVVKLKDRFADISEGRKPITQWFDKIRKQFTELEAQIDPAKPDSVTAKLMVKRNAWATTKMQIQKQKEEEAARKLRAENEKVNLKAEADIQLRNGFLDALAFAKSMLQNIFDTTTLDNYNEHAGKIFNFSEIFTIAEFNALPVTLRAIYLDAVGVENIIMNARIGKYEAWVLEYKEALRQMKLDLTDKLGGKKKELEAMEAQRIAAEAAAKAASEAKNEKDRAAAKAAQEAAEQETARLAKEKADRELKEKEAAAQKEKDDKLKSEQDAEATKQLALTENLFSNAVEVAGATEDVKAIESFEIGVQNPAGWLLIAQFWHRGEGAKLFNDVIEKKTFKQMKTFCEKAFKNTGEKIDSPYIIYSPVYKVRNEK